MLLLSHVMSMGLSLNLSVGLSLILTVGLSLIASAAIVCLLVAAAESAVQLLRGEMLDSHCCCSGAYGSHLDSWILAVCSLTVLLLCARCVSVQCTLRPTMLIRYLSLLHCVFCVALQLRFVTELPHYAAAPAAAAVSATCAVCFAGSVAS